MKRRGCLIWKAETIRRRGVTLVECLVFVSIWSAFSITSLWAIHEAGLLRGNAAMRAELATIAQSELEYARTLSAADVRPGSQRRAPVSWWPENTSCTVTFAPYSAAAWLINVQVERETVRGLQPVELTSIRRAGP